MSTVPDHNIPVVVLPGYHHFECSYGPERHAWNKRKHAESRRAANQVASDHGYQHSKNERLQIIDTKKMDCPADINVKEVYAFDSYKVG